MALDLHIRNSGVDYEEENFNTMCICTIFNKNIKNGRGEPRKKSHEAIILNQAKAYKIGMAMRITDVGNAECCRYMREYLHICGNANREFWPMANGHWPSLV